jgi:hypothetical protein
MSPNLDCFASLEAESVSLPNGHDTLVLMCRYVKVLPKEYSIHSFKSYLTNIFIRKTEDDCYKRKKIDKFNAWSKTTRLFQQLSLEGLTASIEKEVCSAVCTFEILSKRKI